MRSQSRLRTLTTATACACLAALAAFGAQRLSRAQIVGALGLLLVVWLAVAFRLLAPSL